MPQAEAERVVARVGKQDAGGVVASDGGVVRERSLTPSLAALRLK